MNRQELYDSLKETLKKGREKYPHQHEGEIWGGNGYACFVGALAAGLGFDIEGYSSSGAYGVVDNYIRRNTDFLGPHIVNSTRMYMLNDSAAAREYAQNGKSLDDYVMCRIAELLEVHEDC